MVETITARRVEQLRRSAELLEQLQDLNATVSTTSHVISGLLRIGHPTLSSVV